MDSKGKRRKEMTSKPLTAGNPNPKHARTRKRI